MNNEKISSIISGTPCYMGEEEIAELGVKCLNERYSLEKVIEISKTLFQADSDSCYKFLQFVVAQQMERNASKNNISSKIHIHYCLAALALSKSLKDGKPGKFTNHMNTIQNDYSSLSPTIAQLLRAFHSYYSGDILKANTTFNIFDVSQKANSRYTRENKQLNGIEVKQSSVLALIGLAQSNFISRQYQKALIYYKKALVTNKNLPIKARLGMAYCFFELQKYQLAEKCFKRILSLDSNCAQAYLGLGVVNYRRGRLDLYFQNLKKSHHLKPNDPLVILHFSQHFLIQGQYDKCQKMCRKGLQIIETMPKFIKLDKKYRNDYETYKAKFNNLIGQTHHAKKEYQQANKHYRLAFEKGLRYNDIALAQTQIQSGHEKQALEIMEKVFNAKQIQLKIVAEFYVTIAYLKVKNLNEKKIWQINKQPSNPIYYYKQALKYNKNDYDVLVDYAAYLSKVYDKKQALKQLQTAEKYVQAKGKVAKVQLINNVGVLQIENKNYSQAILSFDKAIQNLKRYEGNNQVEQKAIHALHLTVYFNKAVALQLNHRYNLAIQMHEDLIKYNTYFTDSYIRLADVYYQLGRKDDAQDLLENAIDQFSKCGSKLLKIDKLLTFRAYLKYIDGGILDAKQIIRKFTDKFIFQSLKAKYDDPTFIRKYKQQKAKGSLINKEPAGKTQNQKNKKDLSSIDLKQIISQKMREKSIDKQIADQVLYQSIFQEVLRFDYMISKDTISADSKISFTNIRNRVMNQVALGQRDKDPARLFYYLMYIIVLLEVKKLTKEQGENIFNFLKIAEQDFPQIQYNHGVFLMAHGKYDLAHYCFSKYNQKTNSTKANQYISLIYLLKGEYKECINIIKKSILEQPANPLYRFQFAYANQMRIKDHRGLHFLNMSRRFYQSFPKIPNFQFVKIVHLPQMKQRVKQFVDRLRVLCSQRDKYVQSQISCNELTRSSYAAQEQKQKQQNQRRKQELRRIYQNKKLLQQLGDDDESDSEKQRRERKKKLTQLTLMQSEKANQQWKLLQIEKANQNEEGKKKRKPKQPRKPRKQKRQQQKMDQQQYPSEQQIKQDDIQQSQSNQYQEDDESVERLKKKKKKKDRYRDRQDSEDKDKKKKKKKKKKQRKESGEEGQSKDNQRSEKNQNVQDEISDKQSNPFQDEKEKREEEDPQQKELRQREKPQKKRKKNQDQFDYNIDDYML